SLLQFLSLRQRIRSQLELYNLGLRPLAAFDMVGRSAGVGRPYSLALPPRFRIVDAPVHTLGVESHGIGNAKRDELSVHQDFQRISKIAGGERHVPAQPEDVVLINPSVIARLGAPRVCHALELRSRKWVERPTFRTVLSRRGRAVKRPVALAPVEAGEMSACQWHPDDAVAIDVHAARPIAIHSGLGLVPRHLVDFRQSGRRRVVAWIHPNDCSTKSPHRPPDGTAHRVYADAVVASYDPFVFCRINGLFGLYVFIAFAVAVGVEDERRPTLDRKSVV